MADFGKLNFSVSFNRTSAFPLEANSYFTDLEQAEAAAKMAVEPGSADSTYYIGQTLTVADETDCNLYIIKPDQSLKRLTILDTSDVAWENILNKPNTVAGYGITDAYTKTESDDRYVNVSGDTITGVLNILNLEISHNNEINSSDRVCIAYRDTPDGLNVCYNNSPFTYGKDGYKVWHEGNDGDGSGLDADTLDGIHNGFIKGYLHTYSLPYTNDNKIGWWAKIATINVTHQYSSSEAVLLVSDAYLLTSESQYAFIFAKIQQQHAMGQSPNVSLKAFGSIDNDNIVGVLRVTSSESALDIYVKEIKVYQKGYVSYLYGTRDPRTNSQELIQTLPSGDQYVSVNDCRSYSATKLQTPRTIWGQSFDGTNNVNGGLNGVSSISFINDGYFYIDGNGNFKATTNSDSNYWNVYRYDGSSALCVKAQSGNIGIGTTSPQYKLDVNGEIRSRVKFSVDDKYGENSISVGNGDSATFDTHNMKMTVWYGLGIHDYQDTCRILFNARNGQISTKGKMSASSGFYEESDIQLKTNIQPIDFTNNIELVSFNWKKDGSKSYGVIAQQVEQYYPELVSTDESTGYKSVNYDAVLIIKCAQLENRIKQLEKELEDLKNG